MRSADDAYPQRLGLFPLQGYRIHNDSSVIPAKAGIQAFGAPTTPAFAGMTGYQHD